MAKKIEIFVPKRVRIPLDHEGENTKLQEKRDRFFRSVKRALEKFVGKKLAKNYLMISFVEFRQSNNGIEELVCCDRVIATVYCRRTEFNHQETVFVVFPDVFPYIKKTVKEVAGKVFF